ncbi:MAG TPA: DinB family protein [Pyrinomonadaceae bacterium]|nr:DinB family protein [Pyrinomonadaceae bacterium]
MKYESIQDIYDANNNIRARLKELIAPLTDEQTNFLPEGEKWTVAQIVEHVAMVDGGAMRICSRLLQKAQDAGRSSDGKVVISENFLQKGSEIATMKVEAPEFVHPNAGQTIPESLAKLDEMADQLEQMRPLFESVDGTELKFPHPFFGDISAQEWLALKGGHEMRHIKQIENVLAKIN